jgi:hypothetical protein
MRRRKAWPRRPPDRWFTVFAVDCSRWAFTELAEKGPIGFGRTASASAERGISHTHALSVSVLRTFHPGALDKGEYRL